MLATMILAAALIAPQEAVVGKAERFSAVLTAGPLSPSPLPLDIAVNRWGSGADRERLAAAFDAGGQTGLLELLRKESAAGYVIAPGRERLVVTYVEQAPRPDGGRRVLLLCVRDGGAWEFMRDSGWTDHLFRIVALTLDAQGKGAGMLFHVAKVRMTAASGLDLADELSGQATRLLSVTRTR